MMQNMADNVFIKIITANEGETFFDDVHPESPALFEMELHKKMKKLHRPSKEFILQHLSDNAEFRSELIGELMNYTESMNSFLEAIIMKRNKPISDIAEMVAVRFAEKKIAKLAGIC